MSLGYAEKLSYKEDVGKVGMPERFDSKDEVAFKTEELARMIKESRHLVVFTGAGISTSCGIPDFRGPNGIWTLQHQGKPIPKAGLPFYRAMPGLTHMALFELSRVGKLKFCISQNVDCLHLRSGLPRELLAELHGNCFREVCASCKREYVRDFELETIGLKPTGRRCDSDKCRGKLIDTILDWEDALPPDELKRSEDECKAADLTLCLGTSLQITPACNLPLRTIRNGGKIVIVNLQETPKDKKAALVIRAKVDEVMQGVMRCLDMRIPPYIRIDRFILSESRRPTNGGKIRWALNVGSRHGSKAPLPFLRSVEFSFPEEPEMEPAVVTKAPFVIRRATADSRPCLVCLRLTLDDGLAQPSTDLTYTVFPEGESEGGSPPRPRSAFVEKPTRSLPSDEGEGATAAAKTAGHLSLVSTTERDGADKTLTHEYALVTSVTTFDGQREENEPTSGLATSSRSARECRSGGAIGTHVEEGGGEDEAFNGECKAERGGERGGDFEDDRILSKALPSALPSECTGQKNGESSKKGSGLDSKRSVAEARDSTQKRKRGRPL